MMHMQELPVDPLATESEVASRGKATKPKRTRRNKEQMIADDKAAQELGFKDHKDRVKQEGSEPKSTDAGPTSAPEIITRESEERERVADMIQKIQPEVGELIVGTATTNKLPTGRDWKLGEHTYRLVYSDRDTAVFKKRD